MADIRSSQVLGQVEWQEPGLIKASQVILQVEWVEQINVDIVADPIVVTLSQLGSWATGVPVVADPITVTTSISGNMVLGIIIAGGYTGYWPYGYWPEGYWPDDYWHDPSSTVTISTTIPVIVSILGDFVQGLVLGGEPITVTLAQIGLFKHPPAPRDPALDQTFDCRGQDKFGNWDQGIPVLTIGLEGTWLNKNIFADPITVSVSQAGSWVTAILVTADPITVTIGFVPTAVFSPVITLERAKTNWFKWSDIGSLDFAIDKTNVAGERPLDWKGWVYSIRKLGSKVVVYGQNGVSALNPSGKVYGLQTVYRIGLKGKGAVSGDDSVHYFVDNLGQLWRFSEGLEKLDYSEYLSSMLGNLVLSWDTANKLLYICDGSRGYIFSQDSGSLGAGPVNVTGIDSQSGVLYVVSPATIEVPTFQIVTDVYDLGSRRGKNIYSLEIGTDLEETLEAAIEYRLDKAAAFATTDWHVVDPRGFVYLPCYGKEFRFKIKSDVYEYFELDYLTINGEICSH